MDANDLARAVERVEAADCAGLLHAAPRPAPYLFGSLEKEGITMMPRVALSTTALLLLFGCERLATEHLTELGARALLDTYAEARNTNNLALLDSIMDSGLVMFDPTFTGPLEGLDVVKQFYVGTHAAFPDFHLEFDRVRVAGDVIVSEWTISGTQEGPLGEFPPTGRAITVSGVALSRVRNGRIVEDRVYLDRLTLMEQLGFELGMPGVP